MRYFVTFPSGDEIPVDVTQLPTGKLQVSVDGRTLDADDVALAGSMNVRLDGRVIDLWMEGAPPSVGIVVGAQRFYAKVESERMRAASAALGPKSAGEGTVKSPMPGRVLKVLVSEGDPVHAGTALVVVEAMKMENELFAGRDGRVAKVFVAAGETVEGGARLIEIEEA
jgi:glutaconyl-CoA/methylmalonyl-CoA decarboxylase subunit gamma